MTTDQFDAEATEVTEETPAPPLRLGNTDNVPFLAALGNLRTENKHHAEQLTLLYERLIDLSTPADSRWKGDVVSEMERHHKAFGERVEELKTAAK
jgi:hypothetical protein